MTNNLYICNYIFFTEIDKNLAKHLLNLYNNVTPEINQLVNLKNQTLQKLIDQSDSENIEDFIKVNIQFIVMLIYIYTPIDPVFLLKKLILHNIWLCNICILKILFF